MTPLFGEITRLVINLKYLLSSKKFVPIYLRRKFLNKRELGPVAAELHWTSVCNYNCIHCSYGNRRQLREELSGEVINSIIEDLIALNVKGVYLSGGGEPTAFSGWDQYAIELMNHGVEVALITNGVILKESHLPALRRMNYIAVSLYSTDEKEYKEITGGKIFAKQFLIPSLLKQEPSDTVIGARCVFNKINYKSVVSIYQSAMKAGFDYIIFIPAIDYEGTGVELHRDEISFLQELLMKNYDQFDVTKTNVDSLIKRKSHYYEPAGYLALSRNAHEGCKAIQIRGNTFINGCTPDITCDNVKSLIIKDRDYMRLGAKNKNSYYTSFKAFLREKSDQLFFCHFRAFDRASEIGSKTALTDNMTKHGMKGPFCHICEG